MDKIKRPELTEQDRRLWNSMWVNSWDVKKPKGDNEMVEFTKLSKKDAEFLEQIIIRAHDMQATSDPVSLMMDLSAVNQNDCPLDFEKLLRADDLNFAHDICGIRNFINRTTGKSNNHFLPRCTKQMGGPKS